MVCLHRRCSTDKKRQMYCTFNVHILPLNNRESTKPVGKCSSLTPFSKEAEHTALWIQLSVSAHLSTKAPLTFSLTSIQMDEFLRLD